MTIDRRTFLKGAAGAGLAAAAGAHAPFAAAQGEPIRVGLLTVKTGPLASGGIDMERGLAMYLRERNNTLAGRKVEMIVADTGGVPATARTKTQELVEKNRVHVLIGPLAAFEALAIDDYIRQQSIPTLSVAAAEDMTQRKPNPWFARATSTSSQCAHPMADYCAKTLKWKRMALIADDIAYGHEMLAGFQRVFEENGGKVVKKLWPPLVTPDYTPFIAQIPKNVDCVFNGFAGSNPVKFMRSFSDLGLKDRIQLLAGWTAMDDALLRSLGDEAVGVLSAAFYSASSEFEANKRLVAGLARDYKVLSGGYAAGMYIGGQCVEAALAIAGDKSNDGTAFADALHKIELKDSPRGPFKVDKQGNAVGSVFIRRCERKGKDLVNTVIKTYPNVSQFWTYPEAEFLKNPVYSRDYPPAKNLE
jgi:branched-chain amino acid transport system substrate-binding protein